MPRFQAQLTVVLDFEADNEKDAENILQEMEYSFDRPPNKEEMDSEIVNEELTEIPEDI